MTSRFLSSPQLRSHETTTPIDQEFDLGEAAKIQEIVKPKKIKESIGVIGGGIAGCATALRLANKGFKVSIFESSSQLLSNSSDATPCRLGVGFHYMDLETAKLTLCTNIELIRYLIETTGFDFSVRNYQNGILTSKRIYYVIMDSSIVPIDEIQDMFEKMRDFYKTLVKKDPENAVFGPPEDFYRQIDKTEIADLINIEHVVAAYDTCESLFNWPLLKSYLAGKLHNEGDIKIYKGIKIKAISRADDMKMLVVSDDQSWVFDFIINASWYSTDLLNQTLGKIIRQTKTVNRIKCMTVIDIPKSLQNRSFLFAYGPFCALSTRFQDGSHKGYLTYEKVTNIMQIPGDQPFTDDQERYVTGKLTEEEKRGFGTKILEGAQQFIPDLAQATYEDLKLGVVRTDGGEVDICAKDNHFKRTFMGVYPATLGVIVNECRKHTYWCENSRTVLGYLEDQIEMRDTILEISEKKFKNRSAHKNAYQQALSNQLDQIFITGKDDQKPRGPEIKKDLAFFQSICEQKEEVTRQIGGRLSIR